MNVIFKREDFTLCEVPVPQGYPQSQTHSGIAFNDGCYYLVTSPYPNVKNSKFVTYFRAALRKLTNGRVGKSIPADFYENPCLYISEKKSEKPAISFRLMTKGALMENPEEYYGFPTFNSDPDILIDNNDIIVLNRPVIRKELLNNGGYRAEVRLYYFRGNDINGHFSLEECSLLKREHKNIVSPCLQKYKGEYILMYLDTNSYNDGKTFKGLYYQTSDGLKGLQGYEEVRQINVDGGEYIPWHMSLFKHGDKLYTIMACVKKGIGHRCWQMMGEFDEDLTNLIIYKTPLTDYASYRGAACVTDSGLFVLYSTTVHEKIKGSKSVDGRDVIMVKKPFDELLKLLRERE